ncbi:hypothetical protein NPIL_163961 [Nephila pilipes]|uniref:Uncharacterized protein n=1 Tax=Nephila pilipes TaxID=299642 RepID=A0A8X6NL75_NEPPI|nr:hypothetical protein NPIL_163961 [Nephila pilipes]
MRRYDLFERKRRRSGGLGEPHTLAHMQYRSQSFVYHYGSNNNMLPYVGPEIRNPHASQTFVSNMKVPRAKIPVTEPPPHAFMPLFFPQDPSAFSYHETNQHRLTTSTRPCSQRKPLVLVMDESLRGHKEI